MDPSIGPSFWNNEIHHEFKLPMERPIKVPRVEIMVYNLIMWKNLISKSIKESPKNANKLVVKAGKDHWFEYKLAKGDRLSFHITGAHFLSAIWNILRWKAHVNRDFQETIILGFP